MKKMISVFVFAFALLLGTQTFAQELKWYTWEEGYTKATTEKKVLLVDVYTDWCGWCKVMDEKTYADAGIMKQIEKDYVPVKLNPELDGTYKYNSTSYTGRELISVLSANKFSGYPTVFFVNPATKGVVMEVGYKDATSFKIILTTNVPAAATEEVKDETKGTTSKGKKQSKN